ncbi:MAG: hypothetical protein AAF585_17590 [Verrucomicrobiota bacterium]
MRSSIFLFLFSLAAPLWANPAYTESKLEHIIVPEVEFDATPLNQAIEFLRTKSIELDDIEADPKRKGVNIVMLRAANEIQTEALISLKVRNMSLDDLLGYVAQIAGLRMEAHGNAAVIGSAEDLAAFPENEGALNQLKRNQELLNEIRIPQIEFADTPVAQAIEFLRVKSIELDDRSDDTRGINIVSLFTAQQTLHADENMVVSFKAEDVSLGAALHYLAAAAGLEIDVHPEAVVIGTPPELDRMRQILQLPRRDVSSHDPQPQRIRKILPPKN